MLNDIGALRRCSSLNKCYARGIEVVFAVGEYLNLHNVRHKIRSKINRLAAFVRRRPGSYAETKNALVRKLYHEIGLIATNNGACETESCSGSAEGTQEPVNVRASGTQTLCAGRMAQGQNKEANRSRKPALPFDHCQGPLLTFT
jgi:hypothetical protein